MKLRVMFKCPDALDIALEQEFTKEQIDEKEEIKINLSKFISYGENVTIEFDTLEQTAIVIQTR